MIAKTEDTCRACRRPILVGQELCGRSRHANCTAARTSAAPVTVASVPSIRPAVRAGHVCVRCGGPVSTGDRVCGEC